MNPSMYPAGTLISDWGIDFGNGDRRQWISRGQSPIYLGMAAQGHKGSGSLRQGGKPAVQCNPPHDVKGSDKGAGWILPLPPGKGKSTAPYDRHSNRGWGAGQRRMELRQTQASRAEAAAALSEQQARWDEHRSEIERLQWSTRTFRMVATVGDQLVEDLHTRSSQLHRQAFDYCEQTRSLHIQAERIAGEVEALHACSVRHFQNAQEPDPEPPAGSPTEDTSHATEDEWDDTQLQAALSAAMCPQ